MNCFSLWNPWGPALFLPSPSGVVGEYLKPDETRSWEPPASAIGKRIAIATAKRDTGELRQFWMARVKGVPAYAAAFAAAGYRDWVDLPFGCVIGHAILDGYSTTGAMMIQKRVSDIAQDWGNYEMGRVAWHFTDRVTLAKPVPVIGRQGIFDWTPPNG